MKTPRVRTSPALRLDDCGYKRSLPEAPCSLRRQFNLNKKEAPEVRENGITFTFTSVRFKRYIQNKARFVSLFASPALRA